MVVPEREKGVRTFRIPRVVFQGIVFLIVSACILVSVLTYDYLKILKQVYENKHLTIENRQLEEQIQLFQRKLNSLTEDIERIHVFEKKLRIITGFEKHNLHSPLMPANSKHRDEHNENNESKNSGRIPNSVEEPAIPNNSATFKNLNSLKNFKESPKYIELKDLYEQKIATNFGLNAAYTFTKEWSDLTKQSFEHATQFAEFDYKYNVIKDYVKGLEVNIHRLDQYLLDRDSFLKATPTLLPVKGWITSYYGPRRSHYSGRIKMHEGIDIGAPKGRSIYAPADGIITYSGEKPGFGYFVQIDHGYGVETVFGHNKSNNVKKGQIIKRGDLIASVGNTGYSTGPHLHYEVRVNGTPVDPLYFILD
jgi:murein DD-endopeptidase MepM/ murein hydrolase activator NlpD